VAPGALSPGSLESQMQGTSADILQRVIDLQTAMVRNLDQTNGEIAQLRARMAMGSMMTVDSSMMDTYSILNPNRVPPPAYNQDRTGEESQRVLHGHGSICDYIPSQHTQLIGNHRNTWLDSDQLESTVSPSDTSPCVGRHD
jgi:hypothetical protein